MHARRLRCLLALLGAALPAQVAAAQVFVDAGAGGAGDGSSWADAFPDLQSALAVAAGGDEVWVAAGVYRPSASGDRSAAFEVPYRVDLYGGFAGSEASRAERAGLFEQTVLTGDLLGDDGPDFTNRADNSYRVVRIGYENVHVAILDGFTIRGGHAGGPTPDDRIGAGLSTAANFRQIRNCRFVDNFATEGAGALVGPPHAPTFTDCTFEGNRALAGGGALQGDGLVVLRSRFSANVGGRAGALAGDEAYLVGCTLVANRALGADGTESVAGGIAGAGAVAIACVLSGNVAPAGPSAAGALASPGATVQQCTIAGNRLEGPGTAGVHADGGRIAGTIAWGNRDASGGPDLAAQQLAGASLALEYSCVEGYDPSGPLAGEGNTGLAPSFRDPAGPDGLPGTPDDDLRLCAGSPCIDAARNGALPRDRADVDGDGDRDERLPLDALGQPRRVDLPRVPDRGAGAAPVVDMGALEVQADTNTCSATPNSTGFAARIDSATCAPASLANDRLALRAAPVPDAPGVFLYSATPRETPFGNGTLCVGSPRYRLLAARPRANELTLDVDLAGLPGLVPGSTWYFQACFRDEPARGARFDLSDAVAVQLEP